MSEDVEAMDARSEEAIRGREAAAYLKGRREALEGEAECIAQARREGAAEVADRIEMTLRQSEGSPVVVVRSLVRGAVTAVTAALRGDA